jgi:LysR family transcriptional regulator, carnitine catabolism transcriptional activator
MYEIRHIRSFLAVARHSNFTRAAEELHVSQSALTVQIQQLEEALGVRLFDRTRRRVILTEAGREVLPPLERILVDTESVVSRTREISGLRRGIVTVAVLPSVAAGILSEVLRRFTSTHPGVAIQVHDVVAEKVLELVRKEEVDFGVGTLSVPDRMLTAQPLFTDHLMVWLPVKHPLSSRASLTMAQVAQYRLILTGRDSGVRAMVESALRQARLRATPAYETNYVSTALSLVRAGFGIGILPERSETMGNSAGLMRLPISKPRLTRHIAIIMRSGRSPSPPARRMQQILREIAEVAESSSNRAGR